MYTCVTVYTFFERGLLVVACLRPQLAAIGAPRVGQGCAQRARDRRRAQGGLAACPVVWRAQGRVKALRTGHRRLPLQHFVEQPFICTSVFPAECVAAGRRSRLAVMDFAGVFPCFASLATFVRTLSPTTSTLTRARLATVAPLCAQDCHATLAMVET